MKQPILYAFLIIGLSGVSLGLKLLNCDHDRNQNLDVSAINVHFYNFKNGDSKIFPINKAAQGILSLKKLDKTKKFFMFVSGFNTYINRTIAELARNTFKKVPNSYLIIIDHSTYTNDWDGKKKSYERSVKYVYYIGRQLAQFLAGLHKGIAAKSIHCIGHSLGSQILGHVGENFFKATGKKIARISALDPAGPCFADSLAQEQIRSGVAEYVEVYHCNSGGLGTSSVLGDVDFFVNKGKSQPECLTRFVPSIIDSLFSANCNHRTCVTMWMASVARPDWFPAYKCNKYEDFKHGKCSKNDKTIAGFWNPGKATGVYYFSTKGFLDNV